MTRFDRAESYAGRRLLLTGGAGYLATNLAAALSDVACTLVRLDRPGVSFSPLSGRATVVDVAGDVTDGETLARALHGVDLVFHFAAQTSVYVAEEQPLRDLEVNVVPLVRLLELCRQSPRPVGVVFSGTVTEAGIPAQLPVDESPADDPLTVYDLNKLTAERYLTHFARSGVVRGATLRLANVYGPGPRSSSADRGILNLMIRRALGGEAVTIYGDGAPVRDYVFVDDVVDAFLRAGALLDRLGGGHFVIGSGEGHPLVEALTLVAQRVAVVAGRQVPVNHIEPPRPQSPIEARHFVADTTRFSRATGWQARVSLAEGIDRTIAACLAEEEMAP